MGRSKGEGRSFLSGERVVLRPWRVAEAAWYVAARDEAVFAWTTERRDLTVSEAERAIVAVNEAEGAMGLAIVERASGELAGNIALVRRDDGREGEIMYWLAPAGRGRGLATEAVSLLAGWGLEAWGLQRVVLKTGRGNQASRRVAERSGFTAMGEDGEWAWYALEPG